MRDFFISHTSKDAAYCDAINTALRAARFTTQYNGTDCTPGTNIPNWISKALMGSTQMLAICSPDYLANILTVETEMVEWVKQDEQNRHFGPPSFFADKPELLEMLQKAADALDSPAG